ncbi:Scr1 family TA system antitoxin-like transcriptional regulator [Nocardia tengchongensis]|uniref:Scr1 family TA system antitoxin-like transcriptional regulator n=1 Tax=Nocardia tengchongensis TaxID=2055889 RepID=UPI0033F9FCCF
MNTIDDDWARLASRIRERRHEMGLTTRRAFGLATGLSYRLLGDLERGTRSVSDGSLSRVEQALDWQPGSAREILRGGEPTSRDRPPASEGTKPATWLRSMGEAYRIAADLTESGQVAFSNRLSRALGDISQQLMTHAFDPDHDIRTGNAWNDKVPMASPQPTVLGIALGKYMRELRETKGLTTERASDILGWPPADIWLFELGHITIDTRRIRQLLRLYGVTEQRIHRECVKAAGQAEHSGWWTKYNAILPTWLQGYLHLEQNTYQIRTFESHFVPGLLQTADYARAIISCCNAIPTPLTPEAAVDLDKRVNVRMTRQRILDRHNSPKLWAIIDETAIVHPLTTPDVIRDQVAHLIDMGRRNNIKIQVLPAHQRWLSGFSTTFSLLRFADQKPPNAVFTEVVYTEQLTSALYLDSPVDLDEYKMAFDRLSIAAMTPEQSTQYLIALRDRPAITEHAS